MKEKELLIAIDEIKNKIENYKAELTEVNFAFLELEKLKKCSDDFKGIIEALNIIIESGIELNKILEFCPDSVYVADGKGNTLHANPAFEHTTGGSIKEVLGKNVYDLELKGYYKPSVSGIVIREKRTVSIIQEGKNGKETVVTGVPILDEEGNVYKTVTNAKLLSEINNINKYTESKKEQDSKEFNGGIEDFLVKERESMKAIAETLECIKDVDMNLLITGETGVGKSVLSRYIHNCGKTRNGKFVEINCGAIPENLLESELFGYESGAFTGANRKGKQGLIEIANGGTIFFDEINELPLMLQVKLLHFLQNKRITRVGGITEIEVDARVISATNQKLEELVDSGAFRADLYYRLNVMSINIPSLRECPEDILPAAKYFLKKFCEKHNAKYVLTEEEAKEMLEAKWLGNLRELENYCEKKVVMGRRIYENLETRDVLEEEGVENIKLGNAINLNEKIEEYEEALIKAAYEKNNNSYEVAKILGISQTSAYRKIAKYILKNEED